MDFYRQFRVFEEEEEANAWQQALEDAGISTQLDKSTNYLDSVIAGAIHSPKQFILKLQAEDFGKAEKLFEEQAKADIKQLPEDHYLYSFDEKELLEIVHDPENWSKLDYVLAIQLLNEKGHQIDEQYIAEQKSKRLSAQRQPKKVNIFPIILGYTCIGLAIWGGFIDISLMLFALFWPLILGLFLIVSKKTIADGSSYPYYDINSRKHGFVLFLLGNLTLLWIIIPDFLDFLARV